MSEIGQLLTVKQMAERHPAFTERYLRYLITNSKDRTATTNGVSQMIRGNGLREGFVWVGKRVFCDEEKLLEIIAKQNGRV